MAIFKEYLTLSDFLDAKKPVDANNDTLCSPSLVIKSSNQ